MDPMYPTMPSGPVNRSPLRRMMQIKGVRAGVTVVAIVIAVAGINMFFNGLSTRGPAADRNHVTVDITNEGFDPAIVRIQKGTKVTWRNRLGQAYGVQPAATEPGEEALGYGTEQIEAGKDYAYTFDQNGSYSYSDPQNPTVKGMIMVVED